MHLYESEEIWGGQMVQLACNMVLHLRPQEALELTWPFRSTLNLSWEAGLLHPHIHRSLVMDYPLEREGRSPWLSVIPRERAVPEGEEHVGPKKGFRLESYCVFAVVQSLSCVQLFATSWTAAWSSCVIYCLLELIQIHVHWVGHAIRPSHHLSPPSIFPSISVFSNV